MANPQIDEMKAAQFIQKLIKDQESKDDPPKLATKLYVILQHMKCNGKENSMTYQVVLRAMETVIKEHNLDIETLMSSQLPLAAGAQIGDSASQQLTGSSQQVGAAAKSRSEIGTPETYASTRTHSGLVSGGQDMYHGSAANVGDVAAKMSKDGSVEGFSFGDHSTGNNISGKTLDHCGSNIVANADMSSFQDSHAEPNLSTAAGSRDTGKSPAAQASNAGFPFKEQQLKQLRAQCLVFLAFSYSLRPWKVHLESALGDMYSKEGSAAAHTGGKS